MLTQGKTIQTQLRTLFSFVRSHLERPRERGLLRSPNWSHIVVGIVC